MLLINNGQKESCGNFTCKSWAQDSDSDGHEPDKRILLNLENRNDTSHQT